MAGALGEVQLDAIVPVEQASQAFHREQEVLNYVHGTLGIPQFTRPSQVVSALPEDLTRLDDNQLGQLLNVLGQWVGYIDQQLANADSARNSADSYLTYIQARVRIEIKSRSEKKLTSQEKNDIMETNPQVVDAKNKSMFWDAIYRLTKSLRDSVQLSWETASRRITQRGQEVDRMRRETNVAGIPANVGGAFRHRG